MATYGFHSEAAEEDLAATQYYLDHVSPLLAAAFVAEVEGAIQTLLASPTRWAVIEEPHIRRYLLTRFPYSIYYRWRRNKIAFLFMR
jgi:plasmid stabilization system protein ParE